MYSTLCNVCYFVLWVYSLWLYIIHVMISGYIIRVRYSYILYVITRVYPIYPYVLHVIRLSYLSVCYDIYPCVLYICITRVRYSWEPCIVPRLRRLGPSPPGERRAVREFGRARLSAAASARPFWHFQSQERREDTVDWDAVASNRSTRSCLSNLNKRISSKGSNCEIWARWGFPTVSSPLPESGAASRACPLVRFHCPLHPPKVFNEDVW